MSDVICVTSPLSLGCTFVDWSIHFLAGKNKFYSAQSNQWIPVTDNPVSIINAHGHKKNHPHGLVNSLACVDQLLAESNDTNIVSFYPIPLRHDNVAKLLRLSDQLTVDNNRIIQQYQQDDYAKLLKHINSNNIKLVYISPSAHSSLYFRTTRDLTELYMSDTRAKNFAEMSDRMDSVFYSDSIDYWNQQGLTNQWDRRERLALNSQLFNRHHWAFNFQPGLSREYLHVNSQSLWYNGKHTAKKIMEYLEIPINSNRWIHWVDVYHNWQQIQLDLLEFEFNLDYIVSSIINNWYYKLGKLTFEQEVAIQHCLIYHYDMNLKTWGLESFPDNCQELHALLEPNIHKS